VKRQSFHQYLLSCLLKPGDHAFIKSDTNSISYRDFAIKAKLVAQLIKKSNISGNKIGVYSCRSIDTIIFLVGIILSGNQVVPISLKATAKRQQETIDQAKISFILTSENFEVTHLGKITTHYNIEFDKYSCDDSLDFVLSDYDPEHPVYTMFTSGSTGVPKGITITASNLLAFVLNMHSFYYPVEEYIASQTFDLGFDPVMADIFVTISVGGTLCLIDERELMVPSNFIVRNKITVWNSAPSIARFLFNLGQLTPNHFPSLQISGFGGEPLPKYLADAWQIAAPNSTIENLYGPTETTIWISRHKYSPQREPNEEGTVPIGRIFEQHEHQIINDLGNIVKIGQKGELVITGPQVCRGYVNNEEATASSFQRFDWDKDGRSWYRTGDVVSGDAAGLLTCYGRVDSQIKIAGKRVEISEIEADLQTSLGVKQIIVIPIKDDNNIVTRLVAFHENGIDIPDNLDHVDFTINPEFIPKEFSAIEKFPYTLSGKVDKKKLLELIGQSAERDK